MKEIFTTGNPRSGSTWLNRLLGDALSSPLQAENDSVVEYFGPGRDGGYLIRKTHITHEDKLSILHRGPVVFIQRDPRDLVVSKSYYRGGQPIAAVIEQMCNGHADPKYNYINWLNSWLVDGGYTAKTTYESLHENGAAELHRITLLVAGKSLPQWVLDAVWERQSFGSIAKKYGDRFVGSMRKGIVGDWRSHFTRDDAKLLDSYLGDFMIEQGYVSGRDWWKDV